MSTHQEPAHHQTPERPPAEVRSAESLQAFNVDTALNTPGFVKFLGTFEDVKDLDMSDENREVIQERFTDFKAQQKIEGILRRPGFQDFLKAHTDVGSFDTTFHNVEEIEARLQTFEKCKSVSRDLRAVFSQKLTKEKTGRLTATEMKGFDAYVYGLGAESPDRVTELAQEIEKFKTYPEKIRTLESALEASYAGKTTVGATAQQLKEKKELFSQAVAETPDNLKSSLWSRVSSGVFLQGSSKLEEELDKLNTVQGSLSPEQSERKTFLANELERRDFLEQKKESKQKVQKKYRVNPKDKDLQKLDAEIAEVDALLTGSSTNEVVYAKTINLFKTQLDEVRERIYGEVPVAKEIHERIASEFDKQMSTALKSNSLTEIKVAAEKFTHFETLAETQGESANYLDFGADKPLDRDAFREALEGKVKELVSVNIMRVLSDLPEDVTLRRVESAIQRYVRLAEKGLGLSSREESMNLVIETLKKEEKRLRGEEGGIGKALLTSRLISKLEVGPAVVTVSPEVPVVRASTTPLSRSAMSPKASPAVHPAPPASAPPAERPTIPKRRREMPSETGSFTLEQTSGLIIGDMVMWKDRYTGENKWNEERRIESFSPGDGGKVFAHFSEAVEEGKRGTGVRVDILTKKKEVAVTDESVLETTTSIPEGRHEKLTRAETLKLFAYQDAEIPAQEKKEGLRNVTTLEHISDFAGVLETLTEKIGLKALQEKAETMIQDLKKVLDKVGVNPSPYSISKSWALWDIASNEYFVQNPKKNEGRTSASVLTNSTKERECVDAQIGREVYDAYIHNRLNVPAFLPKVDAKNRGDVDRLLKTEPTEDRTLSFKSLIRLGELVRGEVVSEAPKAESPKPPIRVTEDMRTKKPVEVPESKKAEEEPAPENKIEKLSVSEKIGKAFVEFCKGKQGFVHSDFEKELKKTVPEATVQPMFRPTGAHEFYFTNQRETSSMQYWRITVGSENFVVPTPVSGERFEGNKGFQSSGGRIPPPNKLTHLMPAKVRMNGQRWEIEEEGSFDKPGSGKETLTSVDVKNTPDTGVQEEDKRLTPSRKIGNAFVEFCKGQKGDEFNKSVLEEKLKESFPSIDLSVKTIFRSTGADDDHDIYFTDARESSPHRYWLVTIGSAHYLLPYPKARNKFEGTAGLTGVDSDTNFDSLSEFVPTELVRSGERWEVKGEAPKAESSEKKIEIQTLADIENLDDAVLEKVVQETRLNPYQLGIALQTEGSLEFKERVRNALSSQFQRDLSSGFLSLQYGDAPEKYLKIFLEEVKKSVARHESTKSSA